MVLRSGHLIDPPVRNFAPPGSHRWLDACAGVCQDFKYMGLQWVDQCWCSNEYGHHGSAAGCGATGSTCGRGYRNAQGEEVPVVAFGDAAFTYAAIADVDVLGDGLGVFQRA